MLPAARGVLSAKAIQTLSQFFFVSDRIRDYDKSYIFI